MQSIRSKFLIAAGLAAFMGGMALPAHAQQTEIVLWDIQQPGDGSPRGEAFKKNLEAFEAQNPDIKVRVEIIPPPLLDPNLIQSASAGNSPDVTRVFNIYLQRHVAAGSIQPLDQYMTEADKEGWLLPWDKSGVVDGKKYGMPLEYRFSAMLYRKDLLDPAGAQVPKTWDEVCSEAKKVTSPKVMGFSFGISESDQANILNELMETYFLNAGGRLFGEDGKVNLDRNIGVGFLATLKRLVSECNAATPAVVETTYNTVTEGLAAGTIGMGMIGTHRFSTIAAKGAGDNLGWAPPPTVEPGKEGEVNVRGWLLSMGVNAKHPDEAARFIRFMMSKEAQLNIAQGGELPTRLEAYDDPWFEQPEASAVVAWKDYITKHGVVSNYPDNFVELSQLMAQAAQQVILNDVSPEDAFDSVTKQYQAPY